MSFPTHQQLRKQVDLEYVVVKTYEMNPPASSTYFLASSRTEAGVPFG